MGSPVNQTFAIAAADWHCFTIVTTEVTIGMRHSTIAIAG